MMIRKKLAVLMLAGVTCLASGCGNVVKDGTEALGEADMMRQRRHLKRQLRMRIKKLRQMDIRDLE